MIVLYKGRVGCGKTLSMVYDAYKLHLQGFKIYSNFELTFAKSITSRQLLALNRESKLKKCVLVLDELQIFFDSRNFSRDENKNFSYFLQQRRKRGIVILATAQYINTIDLRFRQHINYLIFPEFDEKYNICKQSIFDISVMEDLNPPTNIKPKVIYYNALPIFKLYNTYEMLK